MKTLLLPSGQAIPVLGQGTWAMGEDARRKDCEVAALRLGMDLGLSLIDTAEMYGEGGAEEVVGAAIAGRRDEVFLVSKVYPHNASLRGVRDACERSLRRLGTDRLDLYLLHWRGAVPLADTLDAFAALKKEGKILHYGVSNFDLGDMREAGALPGGGGLEANQVMYNLARRGIEWDLLPWCRERAMPVMAYSPLESGAADQQRLLGNAALAALAARHQATPAQIALAWVLHQDGVIAIPKAVDPQHVRANRAAAEIALGSDELAELDHAFAPPRRKAPLEMR